MEKLTVVGIGPGDYDNMTVRADRALAESEVIIGYGVYIDLVRDRYPDKEFLSTPMTREADRCRMALESARSGKRTAMVCSGDSGIYGMADCSSSCAGRRRSRRSRWSPGSLPPAPARPRWARP